MIQKFLAINFQKHKKLEIDFDPSITVLTGPSDRGKSAVVRALEWLILNEWDKGYAKHGSKFTKAVLTIDGRTITRRKGKKNTYALDGKVFVRDKSGPQIPQEILDVLQMGSDNFQMQLDSPFWFGLSPGQISKELNAIINLEVMDASIAHHNKDLGAIKAESKIIRERLDAARKEAKALAWVKECHKQLAELERRDSKRCDLATRIAHLEELLDKAGRLGQRLKTTQAILEDAQTLIQLCEEARAKQDKIGMLVRLLELEKSASAELPDLTELEELLAKREELEDKIQCLRQSTKLESKIRKTTTLHTALERKLARIRCPLCGRKKAKT